jgi:hypothetical protein
LLIVGFASSDHRVQGMGLKTYIADLKKPPTGKLMLENIYVMLSRATSWEEVAILRPFEESVLQSIPDQRLMSYNQYLKSQDEATKLALEQKWR